MKEQLSTSTGQKPKIELPNKELVGITKEKDLKKDSAKLPKPTGWRILVLPLNKKKKLKAE